MKQLLTLTPVPAGMWEVDFLDKGGVLASPVLAMAHVRDTDEGADYVAFVADYFLTNMHGWLGFDEMFDYSGHTRCYVHGYDQHDAIERARERKRTLEDGATPVEPQ